MFISMNLMKEYEEKNHLFMYYSVIFGKIVLCWFTLICENEINVAIWRSFYFA